jgi:hypothetical protein
MHNEYQIIQVYKRHLSNAAYFLEESSSFGRAPYLRSKDDIKTY